MNRLFFLLMLFPTIMHAQAKNGHFIDIEIMAQDSALLKNADLEIQVYTDGMNSEYAHNIKSYVKKAESNKTSFRIPIDSGLVYGRIFYHRKAIFAGNQLRPPRNLFLFESGDSIQVDLGSKKVLFAGRGSDKYNCLYEINRQTASATRITPQSLGMSKTEWEIRYDLHRQDSLYAVKKLILKNYKDNLSHTVYDLIESDLYGAYHEATINVLLSFIFKEIRDPETDSLIKTIYQELEVARQQYHFNENVLVDSFNYVDFLYRKLRFSAYFQLSPRDGFYNSNYKFAELYDEAKGLPNSRIKDKLIALLFTDKMNWELEARERIPEAIGQISDAKFKGFLLRLQEHGKIAYPFALPDASGKIHKLSDYRGKLILMDFWFSGCTACKILAENMRSVRAYYKNNKDIVFISVSIDGQRYKDVWLKSLEDEVYSSKDDVNLLAEGKNADIINYYHITGFPVLIVISKDGKVISTAPPKPGMVSDKGEDVLVEFLNKYL